MRLAISLTDGKAYGSAMKVISVSRVIPRHTPYEKIIQSCGLELTDKEMSFEDNTAQK